METLVSLFFHELYFPLSVETCNRLNASILRKAIRCFSKKTFLPSKNYLSAFQKLPFCTPKPTLSQGKKVGFRLTLPPHRHTRQTMQQHSTQYMLS